MAADRISDVLIERGYITPEQLDEALALQKETGGQLGWILASEGFVTRQQLYAALAETRGLPWPTTSSGCAPTSTWIFC